MTSLLKPAALLQRRQLLQALALGGLGLPEAQADAQADQGPDFKAIDARLAALVHDPARPLAGLSVLLMRQGQIVYEGQWGSRRLALQPGDEALPINAETMFRVASVSKLSVAVAAIKMVEQGRLDLDAPLEQYLDFRPRHPAYPTSPLTARLLLSHRSSLSDEAGYVFQSPQAMRRTLASNRAWSTHPPGRNFAYANLNLGLLATVMEAISGLRFDRLMRELLFTPLNMSASFNVADFSAAQIDQLATLYAKRSDSPAGERWHPQGAWHAKVDDYRGQVQSESAALKAYIPGSMGSLLSPQGGLRTSLRELSHLMQMLLHDGVWQGQRVLQAHSVALLLQTQWQLNAQRSNGDDMRGLFNAWTLGLQQFTDRSDPAGSAAPGQGDRLLRRGGLQAFGHLGDAYGLLAGFIFNPQHKWGVIYAINGVPSNPERYLGRHSSFSRWEETLLDELLSTLPHSPTPPP